MGSDGGAQMIIDSHTHIFPKTIREDRAAYFSAESAIELLYNSSGSKLVGATAIVDAMDEQHIDMSVVFGFPWHDVDTYRMHNDYILDAVARYPQRLIGLGCFDPLSSQAAAEAVRCIDNGLSGIGELAVYQSIIDETLLKRLEPIMSMLREKDLPLLIHTNEPVGHSYPGKADMSLDQIDSIPEKFPDNTIILAHWGGGIFFFNLLKKEMKDHLRNVYFDTAASPFLYDPAIYRAAVEIVGESKVLFGSDYPLLDPQRYFDEISEAGLSEDAIALICGGNAQVVFKR
jgi:predicted TIM-barrel fold metal-dependent hydrolase